MPADNAPDRLQAASAVLDRVRHNWLGHPGVTAVDVGLSGGDDGAGEPVLRIHMRDQVLLEQAAAHFPTQVEGIAVRVIAARYGPENAGGSTDIPGS